MSSALYGSGPVNPWKEAVLDRLAAVFLDASFDEPPASILRRIIDCEVMIALDPRVSSEAQALIDKGAAQLAVSAPLTDKQIVECASASGIRTDLWSMGSGSLVYSDYCNGIPRSEFTAFVRAIERAHGIVK